jgi:hypothetical protein
MSFFPTLDDAASPTYFIKCRLSFVFLVDLRKGRVRSSGFLRLERSVLFANALEWTTRANLGVSPRRSWTAGDVAPKFYPGVIGVWGSI